jgi:GTPase SAR1 family protein
MLDRRRAKLDTLERRLTGPKRIALFGHRAVGKTTLLAMFYREASTGRVPGVRLAAGDAKSAEYLAEKIAQIEAGEPPAGTLAETELKLRLYHGPGRLDLIVKDYQGEHVTLGADDRPIHEFFADCDAVLLCLDPEGSAEPVVRQRRQQEIEDLLERYIERSETATADRPVALLVTKYDRVLAQEGPPPDRVERLAEARYGMTRHALAWHAPRSAIFAVSSYGREAEGDGRPPAELHPLGLEGPLGWLADQLEAGDVELLEWLWDLAPDDLPRLSRCVRAFERRYPRSDRLGEFSRRLGVLRRRRLKRSLVGLAGAAALVAAGLAGYDAWGYRSALAFERDHAAPAIRDRWARLIARHPTLPVFWPGLARRARRRQAEWTVKAAELQVAHGTAGPGLPEELKGLKDEVPGLAPEIRRVEDVQERQRHDREWQEIQVASLVSSDRPEVQLAALRSFLEKHPTTPHRAEAVRLAGSLRDRLAERQARRERQEVDAIRRAAERPRPDYPDLIRQAEEFLARHPEGRLRGEVRELIAQFVQTIDARDIEKARQYSRNYPTNFATRIERFEDYLKAHRESGRYVGEATRALAQIQAEWDTYTYRKAYDHLVAHPDDVAQVAELLRDYRRSHPDGRYRRDAERYLAWWDRVSTPNDYRVTLRRGQVEPSVGKYLGGGGPDLGVEIEVAGVKHGPSTVIRNTSTPIWDYTFPRPIRWKLGDPVTIRILDYDWSDSVIYTLHSRKGDPLAIRLLSGTIQPSKGGRTRLVFSSDFQMPKLTRPE